MSPFRHANSEQLQPSMCPVCNHSCRAPRIFLKNSNHTTLNCPAGLQGVFCVPRLRASSHYGMAHVGPTGNVAPTVGWRGPRLELSTEVDPPSGYKVPCCARFCLPRSFTLSRCHEIERRKGKFEFRSRELANILPGGGWRIRGFQVGGEGPLRHPRRRGLMRIIAFAR